MWFNNMYFGVVKNYLLIIIFLSLFSLNAYSFDSFEVEDIRVEGIQRISVGTVFNYFPIKVGDYVEKNDLSKALHDRSTGFIAMC